LPRQSATPPYTPAATSSTTSYSWPTTACHVS
jgi:hypothetical protein